MPIHLRAEPTDYAPAVLVPGDPKRARYIAETFFDPGARLVNDVRGALGYTGTFQGRPVSVQSVGMGGPSAVKGVSPGPEMPIQSQDAIWLKDGLQLFLPGDQALPQEMVAAYFEAQDSVILGTMSPAEAAKSVQTAINGFKARQK